MGKSIKKVFWGTMAAFAAITAEIMNWLQLIRNMLLLVLDLPDHAIKCGTVLLGIFYGIGCVYMGGDTWTVLGNLVGGVLVVLLLYKIASFAYLLLRALVGVVIAFFDFSNWIERLAGLLEKSICNYIDNFKDGDPTKRDRLLFAVPFFIHKLNIVLSKISSAIAIAVYPIWGCGAFYLTYHGIYSYDVSNYAAIDHVASWGAIVAVTLVAIYLAHCMGKAIREATWSVSGLDEVFEAYSVFFKHCENNGNNDYSYYNNSTQSDYTRENRNDDARASYNPYIAILSQATSLEELHKLYRQTAKKIHPDVCREYSPEKSTMLMQQLSEAYEFLKQTM